MAFFIGVFMTVSISERLSPLYEGNGINTRFDFTFRVFDQEDANGVSVKHQVGADFENIDESLYSVTINPDNLGGHITFLTAPEVGFEFYIAGETPVDQQLDITNYDNFYPDAIERSLDKLTAILQEWAHSLGFERLSRTKALELLDLALQDQIRNQGLALDQIDAFAKDLANRLETIVVERGWLAELVATKDGKNQQFVNDYSLMKSPELFDAKGGNANDQAVFTNLSDKYAYTCGERYTVPVFRSKVKRLIGNNTEFNVDSVNGDTTVCVQIPESSHYSDINFINNPDQNKPWSYAVVGNRSTLTNVGFYNFDDDDFPKNSWGLYLEDKEDIVLNSPKFGGNGVSDIAIVDNVKNITILNPISEIGTSLDIEPNSIGQIDNINLISGHYSVINILENNYTKYGIGKVNIHGCTVDLLELRGGVVDCSGSTIKDIKGNWYPFKDFEGFQNEYMGSLKIDNANLSENLISDPYLTDISYAQDDAYWSIYAPTQNATSRKYSKEFGFYLDVNPSKLHIQQFTTQDFINIPAGTTHLCVSLSQKLINGSTSNFNPLLIMIYDLNGNLIDTLSYKCSRVSTNSETDLIHEEGVFKLSQIPNAAKFKVRIRCSSGSNMLLKHVGVYAMSITRNPGNFNAVLDKRKLPLNELVTTRSTVPTDLRFGYLGQLIKLPNGKMEYFLNGSSLGVRYIGKNKLYYSFNNVRLNVGANTNVIIDLSAPGVVMGQAVKVAISERLEAMVMISATVTEQDIVRILINNYSSAFDKTVNVNLIVE